MLTMMANSKEIEGFIIKKAIKEDTPLILSFIRQLAEYEKLSDMVVTTEKQIEKYLFGDRPVAEVIIAYYNEIPVGFALFFQNFSTFLGRPGIYLEDLFVIEKYRGKGFGKALLKQLAKIAVERDCGRLEWAVLDWNEPSIKFYESMGASIMKEWLINRVTGKELLKLAE
jgi:GNAT superfamily N-acetyltransferase